jgi:hypothetical protein
MERNNQFIKRWIRWLRETDFDQGQSVLRNENKFCCLGIACHHSAKTKKAKIDENENVFYSYTETGDKSDLRLPNHFRQWIGLTSEEQQYLIDLNDTGSDFDEIADWIEENVYKQEPDFFLKEN